MKRLPIVSIAVCLFFCFTSFHYKNSIPKGTYLLLVEKSKYELSVYDDQGWLATYPVVFGNKDQGDKMVAGDRKTPEGSFKIVSKRVHEKWDRFMLLDYPNADSYYKFNKRKNEGLIPKTASIGGGIGIHGTWPREGYAIDRYDNWTEGCISMRNEDVEELYKMIPIGTPILIRR